MIKGTEWKPVFLCDVDGITANFMEPALTVINGLSGKSFMERDIVFPDIQELMPSLTMRDAANARFARHNFCHSIPAYPGSRKAVKWLNESTEFHFVTAPMTWSYHWMPERMDWLVEKFDVPHRRIHFVTEKHIIDGDFFLEDSVKNLTGWMDRHPDGVGLLWERPWNRAMSDERIVRVSSWREVRKEVRRFNATSGAPEGKKRRLRRDRRIS